MIRRRAVAALSAIMIAPAMRAGAQAKVSRAWPVMGTMFVATVWGTDTAVATRSIHAARDSVRLVDSLMSNYRPDSEISRVNAAAGGGAVPVSAATLHVLLHARELWRMSGGRFDPTVGPLVRAWGFHGDVGRVPPRAELDSLRALVGYERVVIDTVAATVRLPAVGMSLDLGGIAKGYALDLARSALRDSTISGGMLDLGGNILVFGRPPEGERWIIGIRHPRRNGSVIGTVALDSGAVATSGDYEHFYMIAGIRYGHIIDPTTGYPRRGVLSATAIGPRGEWSDGLSATLFLAGPERGRVIADSLNGVAAIWVTPSRASSCGGARPTLSRLARPMFAASCGSPGRTRSGAREDAGVAIDSGSTRRGSGLTG